MSLLHTTTKTLESSLEAVRLAAGYQRWLSTRIADHLIPPVLEIGAGLGGFTAALADLVSPVLVSEPDPSLEATLARRFHGDPRIHHAPPLFLPAREEMSIQPQPHTIVLANVLEHIENDEGALVSLATALPASRKLILVVPAHSWAYTRVDHTLGHFRRYTTRSLRRVMDSSPWRVEETSYFNPIGILLWLASGRVLGRSTIEPWHATAVESLLPVLRAADRLLAGRCLGQSLIAVASR